MKVLSSEVISDGLACFHAVAEVGYPITLWL